MNFSNASFKDVSLLKFGSYINGEWLSGTKTFAVINPATQEIIGEVNEANSHDCITAVHAAKKAQAEWKRLSANAKHKVLMKWFQLILEHQDDLALIMTLEQGKPLKESLGEIKYGATFVEWFAEQAKRIAGETLPSTGPDKRVVVTKQPIGVVGAITPWNFPSSMITRKAAPALAAGCSIIVKPAAETPFSALALAELADRAGIPAGVFNVVVSTDAQAIGEVLTTHPDIAKFSFTGSTAVGKKLLAQCASTVKKVSLELGGNAPFIVFEDADIDAAVQGAMASKFRNSGQTCVCSNRFLVHTSVYDQFAKALAEQVNQLNLGNGWEQDTQIAPLIHPQAFERVKNWVTDATMQGAKIITKHIVEDLNHATLFSPMVLTQVKPEMTLAAEEIFGPIAPLIPFQTEQQAIELANDTRYGLAAYFYSRDVGRCFRVADALEYGMVGINEGFISNPTAPFGGVKESGIGREGSHYGIEEFLETKYMCFGGLQ